MNCASIDLKTYFLGECDAAGRHAVDQHLTGCDGCREELERLRLTQAALLTVRDEEIPRRIAFVSDKVFEPRWYQRLWQSGARLGFAGAAMLSCAILVHAFYRPPAPVAPMAASTVDVEAQVQREVAQRLQETVRQAVGEVEERQQKRTAELLATSEKRMLQQHSETMAAVDASFVQLSKRFNYLTRQQMASVELGGRQ